MSQIISIISKFTEILTQNDVPNPKNEVELLISYFTNTPKNEIYLKPYGIIDRQILSLIEKAVEERRTRKPLQYIIGNVPFLDTTIKVNGDVLIPRPETEFMVDRVIKELGISNYEFIVLDLCTGSGAIAIAIKKKFPKATVYASDICEKALQVAKSNAEINNVEINFVKSDLFENINKKEGEQYRIQFDIIISNPPYIPHEIYTTLQPEIYFEPKIAFVSDNNGLYFYEKIISQAKNFMKPNGTLYLEIGENQAKCILSLAKKHEYINIDLYKDLCEKDRIVRLKI